MNVLLVTAIKLFKQHCAVKANDLSPTNETRSVPIEKVMEVMINSLTGDTRQWSSPMQADHAVVLLTSVRASDLKILEDYAVQYLTYVENENIHVRFIDTVTNSAVSRQVALCEEYIGKGELTLSPIGISVQ